MGPLQFDTFRNNGRGDGRRGIAWFEDDWMRWTWTWAGRCFGYWEGNDLWTRDGKHVGRRHGVDVYSPSGRYIGEVMANGRLATNKAKAALLGPTFIPLASRKKQLPPADLPGFQLYAGFDDFPSPYAL